MGFFKRHQGRASYKLFSNYSHYLPGYGGMFALFGLFIAGSLIGSLVTMVLAMVSPELSTSYGMIISYPIMFIPPMLYASVQSRLNDNFSEGVELDRNNFGKLGGWGMALVVSIATVSTAFIADCLSSILPPMPDWIKEMMDQLMNGPTWVAFLSVSIFAPLFEEWLCRGLVLRGLLTRTTPATAIVVSAIFFAILHMNPWQAVPAFLLGLIFGYVYYRTGSLKLTMLMHFVNNTLALALSKIPSLAEYDSLMDVLSPWAYASVFVACVLITASSMVIFRAIPLEEKKQL